MNKKKNLGRGIGNFLADSRKIDDILKEEAADQLIQVNLEDIDPNENQPRKEFDEKSLKELSESITLYGVIQPLILRKKENRYCIIAGERRYRASKLAGLSSVPALVKEVDDVLSDKMALIENIQRKDLNAIEEAHSYKKIMKTYDLTQEELARAIGKSRQYVGNTMRLLKLDPRVIEMIEKGKLSPSHGKVLLGINDWEKQVKEAKKIIASQQSVAETEEKAHTSPSVKYDIYLEEMKNKLMENLGTKVNFKGRGKKKKIEIEYYSEEELTRICEIILGGGSL